MSRQCSERYVSSVLRFGAVLTITLTALAFVVEPHLLQRVAPHFAVPFFPYIALAIGLFAIILSTGVGSLLSDRFALVGPHRIMLWSGALSIYLAGVTWSGPGLTQIGTPPGWSGFGSHHTRSNARPSER